MKRLSPSWKKAMLGLHLTFTGILLGCTAVIVVLVIASLATEDEDVLRASYTVMHLLATSSIRASSIGTVVTGVILSVFTHWGLLRYYWIVYKIIMTALSVAVGVVGFYYWSLNGVTMIAEEGMRALDDPAFVMNNQQLWLGLVFQVLSLVSMVFVSVFKPWGKRVSRV